MKKFLKVLCACFVLISASLILFACNDAPKKLLTPTTIALVNNGVQDDENGEFLETQYLLVTQTNEKASGYRFFITDSEDYLNKENYVTYNSTVNYFNVTSIFDSKKEYHFFVQYVGDKMYEDSNYSKIESYVPSTEKVKTPYLQLVDEEIYWTKILNAKNYEVYETILNKDDQVVVNKTKIETLNSNVYSYNLQGRFSSSNYPYYKYVYSVKALSDGFYLNSDISNDVEYVKEITLNTPTNLMLEKQDNNYILKWDEIPYCTSYEIKINNIVRGVAEGESFDVTSYLDNYATYSFSVQAKTSDAIKYNEGEYSNLFNYDYTTKLDAPTNLEIVQNGEYLNIIFDYNTDATQGYLVEIYYNSAKRYDEIFSGSALNINGNKVNIQIQAKDVVGELNANKQITVFVQARKVSNYIFASDKASEQFTISKVEIKLDALKHKVIK